MGRLDDVGETSLAAATAAIITARWSAIQTRPARAQVSDGGGGAGDHAAWAPPTSGAATGASDNGTYGANGHGSYPSEPYANGSPGNGSSANGSYANGSPGNGSSANGSYANGSPGNGTYDSVDAFGSDTYRSGAHGNGAAEAAYEPPPYGDGFGDAPFTGGFGGTSFGDEGGHGIGGSGFGESRSGYGDAPSGFGEAEGNGHSNGNGYAATGNGFAAEGNGYAAGGNGFAPAAGGLASGGFAGDLPQRPLPERPQPERPLAEGTLPEPNGPERTLPRAAHGDAAARGAAAASFFAATQLDPVPEVFPAARIPGQRSGDADEFSLGSVMADLPFPEPFAESFEPPSFDTPSLESLSFGAPPEGPSFELPSFDLPAFDKPSADGGGFSAFGPPSAPTLPPDEVTGTRVPPGFERRTFGPHDAAPAAPAMGLAAVAGVAPPSPGFAEFAPGLDPGTRLEPAGRPRRGHAAEPEGARGPVALLPRRVPQVPDVPDIALFANDPLLDPTAAPATDGFELTRIATYLRDDEDDVVAEHRPDGFDFADVLEAVRGVRDVRDAHLRWNSGAGHTLRIEFTDGADEGDVTRAVVRLLREKMGLAAAPSLLGGDEATLDRPYPRSRGSVIASATVPARPGVGVSVGNATRGGSERSLAPALPRPSHVDGSRVVVDHVTVTTVGADATVEVRLVLSRGGAPAGAAVGSGRGPAVDAYLLRLSATSAAAALDQLLNATGTARGRCFVEHVAVVPFGVVEVAVVVMLLAHGGHTEQLAGSAIVAGDPQQAVVRATLAALNRRLESLLA